MDKSIINTQEKEKSSRVRRSGTEGVVSGEINSAAKNPKDPDKECKRKRRRKRARLTGLSQQRQAANARERYRTKCVRAALLELRYHLPLPRHAGFTGIKLSKYEILTLATKYIKDLAALLKETDPNNEASRQTVERCTHSSVCGISQTGHLTKRMVEKTQEFVDEKVS